MAGVVCGRSGPGDSVLAGEHDLSPTQRPAKTLQSIVDKLPRQSTSLAQVQDIAGCKVVVPGIPDQDALTAALRGRVADHREYDRRDQSSHGYRAVHFVARVDGRRVEVQVRTELQHLWAQLSELAAQERGHELKYGEGDPGALRLLMDYSNAIARLERCGRSGRDFEPFESPWWLRQPMSARPGWRRGAATRDDRLLHDLIRRITILTSRS
jgi:hypothetical protein